MKKIVKLFQILVVLPSLLLSAPQIGQSAIQSLVFPWGGKSLGMAETFTGVSDNLEALFYNPAGLGQTPLATSWTHFMNDENKPVNILKIAAKENKQFSDKEIIWSLDDKGNIYRYNGVTWVNYSVHVIDSGETL
jgi:hypothetical protein